jgi:predicted porin
MKKSLLAIAAMTAFAGAAQAQSSVTVYGVMDVGVIASDDKVAAAATGVQTQTKQLNTGYGKGAMASSRLGFKGTEDIGGGTKANFVLEYGLKDLGIGGTGGQQASGVAADAATTTATAAGFIDPRQSWVGLEQAGKGEIRLGRQFQSIHQVVINGSAGGGANVAGTVYSGGENGGLNTASIRPELVWSNRAVTYVSPTFNGWRFEAQNGTQNINSSALNAATNPTSAATDTGAAITYAAGKLSAGLGYNTVKIKGAATDDRMQYTSLSANYDFGPLKLFGLASMNAQKNGAGANLGSTNAYEVGVKAPVTATVDVWASTFTGSRTSDTKTAAALASVSTGVAMPAASMSGWQFGSAYKLSKRTSLYAIYGTQQITGKDASSISKNQSTAGVVGINHTF